MVKLSGLFGGSGSATAATDDELARVVELVRSRSPERDRTMIGSDWPMAGVGWATPQRWTRLDGLLGTWSTPRSGHWHDRNTVADDVTGLS